MKKVLMLVPILTLLITGCSLKQKAMVDNSSLNQPIPSSEAQNDKQTIDQTQPQNLVGASKETDNTSTENKYVTKTISNRDSLTGKELPTVKMRTTQKVADLMKGKQFGVIAMPSIIDYLLEKGVSNSDPKMRVIGPSYQILPQGENFGGVIDFSFCYFDEDIRGYNEKLFYVGKENSGVWENIGGTPKPEDNCVDISLESAPDYTIAVYAGEE